MSATDLACHGTDDEDVPAPEPIPDDVEDDGNLDDIACDVLAADAMGIGGGSDSAEEIPLQLATPPPSVWSLSLVLLDVAALDPVAPAANPIAVDPLGGRPLRRFVGGGCGSHSNR